MELINLTIPGFSIACKVWGNPQNPPILALHGWLDNANSFDLLAERLKQQFYFIAIDLPGHGHSSHISPGCQYHFSDGIFTVIEIINALKLTSVHLLGHSMGACLGSLIAGVTPERILSLALIEGLGPFSSPAETACQQLADYLHQFSRKAGKTSKGYKSLEAAILARAAAGYVSYDIAKILCERAVFEKDGGFHWRHDRRLIMPSPLRMTEEQVLSCLKKIAAKTTLYLASDGFSFDSELMRTRLESVENLKVHQLEGGHHIHMEKPEVIATLLADFYR